MLSIMHAKINFKALVLLIQIIKFNYLFPAQIVFLLLFGVVAEAEHPPSHSMMEYSLYSLWSSVF